jgi:hypothetical protein
LSIMQNELKENANWFSTDVQQKAYVRIRMMMMLWRVLSFDFSKIRSSRISSRKKFSMIYISSLAVELGFGQKFKPDPRVDVRPGWTDQSSQPDPRVDVRRVLSSLSETSYI